MVSGILCLTGNFVILKEYLIIDSNGFFILNQNIRQIDKICISFFIYINNFLFWNN